MPKRRALLPPTQYIAISNRVHIVDDDAAFLHAGCHEAAAMIALALNKHAIDLWEAQRIEEIYYHARRLKRYEGMSDSYLIYMAGTVASDEAVELKSKL